MTRTVGDTAQQFRVSCDPRYNEDEWAKPGQFAGADVGKIHQRLDGTLAVTEVVSMGLRWMYERPVSFAYADPGDFDSIYHLMHGGTE